MPDDRLPQDRTPADDAANRLLDELTGNGSGDSQTASAFDEETAAALQRFFHQGTTPLPSAARDRAWQEVRSRIAPKQVGRQRAALPIFPQPSRQTACPSASHSDARTTAQERPVNRMPTHAPWRRAVSFAAPVLLVLAALVTGLMTVRTLIVLDGNADKDAVTTFHGGNARTGVMPGSGPGESATVRWDYRVAGEILGSPAVVDGVVYVTGGTYVPKGWSTKDVGSGVIVALDAATGKLRWRTHVNGFTGTSPAVADGTVYVATEAGDLLALDTETGDRLWRYDLGDRPFLSSPAVADGAVYLNGGAVASSPAVVDGVVYTGSGRTDQSQGSVTIAVDATTGSERWRFASSDNGYYALDAQTGTVRWHFSTAMLGSNSTAVADGAVFAVDAFTGALYALDIETGTPRWQFVFDGGGMYATPAVEDGVVYVTDQLGNLYAVDAETGTERWRYVADALVNASPVVAGDAVYLADRIGNVVVIDAATGQARETIANAGQIGNGAVASPVIVEDVLFVPRADGHLVAFGASPPVPP